VATINKKSIFIAVALILTGCLIYATCRQDIIALSVFGKANFLESIKIDIHYQGNIFTYFLLFCLPDMLWYFALLLIQKQFYNKDILLSKILFYCALSLPFVFEMMQYFGTIRGTFDIADISFYLLTLIIFIVLWKQKIV
jgi:hypothetical protein